MANKVKFGLEQVHIAFKGANGYENPQAILGAVNLTMNPEGGETAFYANNR